MDRAALLERVKAARRPCRRLDAELVAVIAGPQGCLIDPDEDVDGWGIFAAPNGHGECTVWMCAADVPYVTAYLDACSEVLAMAGRTDMAALCTRALHNITNQGAVLSPADFGGWLARAIMAELLQRQIEADSALGRDAA
jgi:hypothetical protein